jgi:hypothetical protein
MNIQLAQATRTGALKARSIVACGNAPGAEQPRILRAEEADEKAAVALSE